ncbi:MAG: hypothetical protein J0J06_07530 [Sphingomonas sp.]|uniref:hypothetical protein n=1 Tax=Sphingomonas sp. TaxID=28214 RepID=UPI001AD33F60|nr:hypothetical protein [Sphingomonas sp.]MBN8815281.1 hypothetical protein [Sphingomonas sp.]
MSVFEYFLILFSVVLSLALTQLISGVGELVRARPTVRWTIGYALWLTIGLSLILDLWTSLWLVRTVPKWSLATLVFLLLQASAIFLYILWLVPKPGHQENVDLGEHALEERHLYLAALTGYVIAGVITNFTVLPKEALMDWASYAILPPSLVLIAIAWLAGNRWVQLLIPAAIQSLMITYFILYFPTIG